MKKIMFLLFSLLLLVLTVSCGGESKEEAGGTADAICIIRLFSFTVSVMLILPPAPSINPLSPVWPPDSA